MKKGFTLIELLAVILILGIIALIAIPTVNNILKEARRGALQSTVNNISKAVEERCTLQQIKNEKINTIYILNNGKMYPEIDIKGDLPEGTIYVNQNCDISYHLHNNNFKIQKNTFSSEENIIDLSKNIYYDSILNGADPVLDYGMIPVEISNNGEITKASLTEKWYDYKNQKWANAILVKEDKRDTYLNANEEEIINTDDILGYFVWIPRFKYAIPNGTNPRSINIVFEDIFNPKSHGSAIDNDYYSHPAFSFGNTELNGLWVAKFETSGEPNMPLSLPGVSSINTQLIEEQFNSALLLNDKSYGVLGNSHMMKNSEWGAMVYLSHSKYGINKEIRINNVNPVTTGCGAASDNEGESSSCTISFGNGNELYPQSSTGNIYGIFDISGGRFERLMSFYNPTSNLTGFTAKIDKKYFDLYTNISYDTACNNSVCKGHALTETKNWYDDYYLELNTSRTWLHRGGLYLNSNVAGAFFVDINSGGAGSTYRLVINNDN